MTTVWESATIGDLCDVVNGGTPKTGTPAYWDGPHQWITPAEMGKRASPYVEKTARTITDEGLANSSAQPLPPHSVILSTRAPIGHLVINTEPMATNQGCKGLVPRGKVDHKFLYYYLGSIVDHLNDLGTGATFKELSGGKLKEVRVPTPSIVEQQRIVAILDEAFEGIAIAKANAEKNLQNARELFAVYSDAAFATGLAGGTHSLLGSIASFRNGINYTKRSKGESVRIVGVKDFKNNFWAPQDDLDEVVLDGALNGNEMLSSGDILAVRSNGNPELIGRTMLVGDVAEPITHSGFTIRIRVESADALPRYVCHLLKSPKSRRTLVDGGNGASIRSLNQGTLASMVVPLPSIDAQRAICSAIEDVEVKTARLEGVYRRKLAALEELKKSLLHRAFSGRLTLLKQAQHPALQTTTPEFSANVISLAHARHERQRRERTFGHVKEQKTLQLIESIAGIDLGRKPMRDAAGPNDFQHMRNAEKWAREQSFFDMVKNGEGYEFKKLRDFDQHMSRARLALEPYLTRIEPVIDLLVPMDTEDAEVFATVHAAWSNLLIDELPTTDDAIVYAARNGWHPDKLRIPEYKFRHAIEMIRKKKLEPDGSAKYVGGQQPLL